jgi:heme d1 biosynthesis radical SAM protein NirJ
LFRLSQFIAELDDPTPAGPRRDLPGPVVVWNLIRRCNLSCLHCYSISSDKDFPGELSTREVFAVMDDLEAFRVPVLILSGGEPLLREDILEIAHRAVQMGFATALSTNGTLIDESRIDEIAEVDFDYVGISVDGLRQTHDRFRGREGAFEASLRGIRLCRDRGLKVGLRFTMTRDNAAELPEILDLVEAEGIHKFYLSHLNYAGRGNRNRESDAVFEMTRRAMDLLFEASLRNRQRGVPLEIVTGNNDADGVYLLLWVKRHFPEKADHLGAKLAQWGGNASGVNVANIDNRGNVHPDGFWWHYSLGNLRERAFSEIWRDTSDPLMAGLKTRPRPLEGRCGACRHLDICGGNTRVRAHRLTGNPWAEDPGCYLGDEEIGVCAPEPPAELPDCARTGSG